MKRPLFGIVFAAAAWPGARGPGPGRAPALAWGRRRQFGTVNFPVSCRADVAPEFTRAVALLHSFGYEESRRSFEAVAAKDPGCGMAYWGIAMTYYHPIWAPPNAGGARRRQGRRRESGGARRQDRARARRTSPPSARSTATPRRSPTDRGPAPTAKPWRRCRGAFRTTTRPRSSTPSRCSARLRASDLTFANQKKAAAILNGLLPRRAEHPGIAHYMIHAFDYPPLASEALPAARAYAKIAPVLAARPPHALAHLHAPGPLAGVDRLQPRLGRRGPAARRQTPSRRRVLRRAPRPRLPRVRVPADRRPGQRARGPRGGGDREDVRRAAVRRGLRARRDSGALDARAAGLEGARRRSSCRAADLPWERFPYAPALTYFARALGAARTGQLDRARAALAKLAGDPGGPRQGSRARALRLGRPTSSRCAWRRPRGSRTPRGGRTRR